jgi:protein-L-isoaspartate(D-aspartate) O-methyltransferase
MVRLQLEARGITDGRLLEAMRKVPRHRFIPRGRNEDSYGDFPVPIGCGQTISQPYMVAFMTDALSLTGRERVLEVGTGSGYQAAVLAELSFFVYSVERMAELHAAARRIIGELGYANVRLILGDGGEGIPEEAPFDRVLVAAAAPSVPSALCDQLSDNGVMVVPVGDYRFSQVLVIVRRIGNRFQTTESIGCRFVPLVGEGGFNA